MPRDGRAALSSLLRDRFGGRAADRDRALTTLSTPSPALAAASPSPMAQGTPAVPVKSSPPNALTLSPAGEPPAAPAAVSLPATPSVGSWRWWTLTVVALLVGAIACWRCCCSAIAGVTLPRRRRPRHVRRPHPRKRYPCRTARTSLEAKRLSMLLSAPASATSKRSRRQRAEARRALKRRRSGSIKRHRPQGRRRRRQRKLHNPRIPLPASSI